MYTTSYTVNYLREAQLFHEEFPDYTLLWLYFNVKKKHQILFLFQLFTSYFSRPIKYIFHGSVEFNLTVRALGQKFFMTFRADDVTGRTILGGTKCAFSLVYVVFIVVLFLLLFSSLFPLLLLLLRNIHHL